MLVRHTTSRFELCPIDTGAIVLDSADEPKNWREAKKLFKGKGYKGKHLLLERYDSNGNVIVHRVTL